MPNESLTTEIAAERLQLSESMVKKLIGQGLLVAKKHGRDWAIDAESVKNYQPQAVGRQPTYAGGTGKPTFYALTAQGRVCAFASRAARDRAVATSEGWAVLSTSAEVRRAMRDDTIQRVRPTQGAPWGDPPPW